MVQPSCEYFLSCDTLGIISSLRSRVAGRPRACGSKVHQMARIDHIFGEKVEEVRCANEPDSSFFVDSGSLKSVQR